MQGILRKNHALFGKKSAIASFSIDKEVAADVCFLEQNNRAFPLTNYCF